MASLIVAVLVLVGVLFFWIAAVRAQRNITSSQNARARELITYGGRSISRADSLQLQGEIFVNRSQLQTEYEKLLAIAQVAESFAEARGAEPLICVKEALRQLDCVRVKLENIAQALETGSSTPEKILSAIFQALNLSTKVQILLLVVEVPDELYMF